MKFASMRLLVYVLLALCSASLPCQGGVHELGWISIEPPVPEPEFVQFGSGEGPNFTTASLGSSFVPCSSTPRPGQPEIAESPTSAEIKALARNLENDPLRIYNYVRSYIRYTHYFGA